MVRSPIKPLFGNKKKSLDPNATKKTDDFPIKLFDELTPLLRGKYENSIRMRTIQYHP